MTETSVTIYTDGSSLGNPGPGGWGAILIWVQTRRELSRGYLETTNNRMEIRGVLHALEHLKRPCTVQVHTDSRYVCDAISKKWIQSWIKNGWLTSAKKPVKNRDLWEQLLPMLQKHRVSFHWVKAHDGQPENERCDELAKNAARERVREVDEGYEGSV
ncbi:MAG: ribonuclease HI [Desulfomicrobium sp.]|nr:ribonuclease HI [Desulfomicrobium sp.]